MTPSSPHPLRCETCEHWKRRHQTSKINTCEILNANEMTVIPIGESEITAIVGCASHSGAQQQAPVIFEGQSRFACPFQNGCEDGDGFCEYPCEKWLDWHDAAIATQARKEGYAEGAAAERERVINEVCKINIGDNICKKGKDCKSCAWESLRSQPEKQQYCKHLKWLTQVEGGGEYRCELGNKTSDEWCYKKEQCGDYELVPECGACTGPDLLDVLEQRIDYGISALHEQGVDGSLPRIILGKLEILAWVKQAITEIRQQVKK